MEDELYDCPHCNAGNIVMTKDGLCPNGKQITGKIFIEQFQYKMLY